MCIRDRFLLSYIGLFYDEITPIKNLDGVFGPELTRAVESFQQAFGLPVTGVVDEKTWNAMVIVYLSYASDAGEANAPDGQYPGYVMTLGSAGIEVRRLQRYMNSIAARYCFADFVPDTGIFDEQTDVYKRQRPQFAFRAFLAVFFQCFGCHTAMPLSAINSLAFKLNAKQHHLAVCAHAHGRAPYARALRHAGCHVSHLQNTRRVFPKQVDQNISREKLPVVRVA